MSETLNPRILKKLEEVKTDDKTKQFLKELLIFELQHIEYSKPPYQKYYDPLIEKYSKEKEA